MMCRTYKRSQQQSTAMMWIFVLATGILVTVQGFAPHQHPRRAMIDSRATTPLLMTEEANAQAPASFREAEVLGLKLMQEGNYELALDGKVIQ